MKRQYTYLLSLTLWLGCSITAAAESISDATLQRFESVTGKERIEAANRIFRQLNDDEVTDSLMQFTADTPTDTLTAQLYFWVGEQRFFSHDFVGATTYFNKALPVIGSKNLGLLGDTYNELAICHARRGLFSQALEAANKAQEAAETLHDKERLVTITNIIGSIYVMAKQSPDAEKHLLRSLALAKELNDSVKMAVRYGTLSELYHTLEQDEKSVEYARQALRLDSLRGDQSRMAIRKVQLASPLFALGQTQAAKRLLMTARPALEKSHNLVSLAICLDQLGYVALRQEQWAEATRCFEQVISIYARTGERYGESKAQWGLWEALRHSDPRRAAEHLEAYAILKDSLYQQDVARMTADYDARYENNELRLQNEQERLHNRMIHWIEGIIIAALMGGVILLLYILRLRTRNTQMKQQLDQVRDQLLTPADREFLTRVDQLLDEQMKACNVNLEELASSLCITRAGLNRRMKTMLDESMREHANRIRIERAKQLMDEGGMNISEVARTIGIDDVAYFSRFFRKMTGMSPSQYREAKNNP